MLLRCLIVALFGPLLASGFNLPRPTSRGSMFKPSVAPQFWSLDKMPLTKVTSTQLKYGQIVFEKAIVVASLCATGKVLSGILMGGLAARKRRGVVLDAMAVSVLTRLTFTIFQPAFLLCSISRTCRSASSAFMRGGLPPDVLSLMPVIALINIGMGALAGAVVGKVAGLKGEEKEDMLVCSTFSNSGPLPLIFAQALFSSNQPLLRDVTACIAIYVLAFLPVFWSVAPVILGMLKGKGMGGMPGQNPSSKVLKNVVSPPVIGSIVGVIIGKVPIFQRCFFGGFLTPIFEAADLLGQAYLPCALLILAGSVWGRKEMFMRSGWTGYEGYDQYNGRDRKKRYISNWSGNDGYDLYDAMDNEAYSNDWSWPPIGESVRMMNGDWGREEYIGEGRRGTMGRDARRLDGWGRQDYIDESRELGGDWAGQGQNMDDTAGEGGPWWRRTWSQNRNENWGIRQDQERGSSGNWGSSSSLNLSPRDDMELDRTDNQYSIVPRGWNNDPYARDFYGPRMRQYGPDWQYAPSSKAIVSIFWARFVIVPALTLLSWNILLRMGALNRYGARSKAIVSFVMLLQACMPPTQKSVIVLQLEGRSGRAIRMAKLVTLMYSLALVPMTFLLGACLAGSGIMSYYGGAAAGALPQSVPMMDPIIRSQLLKIN
jgi:predicted permease